jgi:hypothetical protein
MLLPAIEVPLGLRGQPAGERKGLLSELREATRLLTEGAKAGATLSVCRIIRSTSGAKDREIVDLAFLGMHQNHTTFCASKINRIIACIENWRRADKAVVPWSPNGL